MSETREPLESAVVGRPLSVSPVFAVVRIVLAVALVGLAAILLVEGVLIRQVGLEKPLIGRITAIVPGQPDSTVAFAYMTTDGKDHAGRCDIPSEAARDWEAGKGLEIHQRVGLFGTYACAREGLDGLRPAAARTMYLGLGAGLASLAMIAWLLMDLARYSRTLDPAHRVAGRFSAPS